MSMEEVGITIKLPLSAAVFHAYVNPVCVIVMFGAEVSCGCIRIERKNPIIKNNNNHCKWREKIRL